MALRLQINHDASRGTLEEGKMLKQRSCMPTVVLCKTSVLLGQLAQNEMNALFQWRYSRGIWG